nr:hypothetical protein [Paenarthrobacter ureafaciens]
MDRIRITLDRARLWGVDRGEVARHLTGMAAKTPIAPVVASAGRVSTRQRVDAGVVAFGWTKRNAMTGARGAARRPARG